MQGFPHHYRVSANATAEQNVELTSPGLVALDTAAPAEFGGPGDKWSPETLLAAAVADCFVLSFRAIARASRFEWLSIECDVDAVLDKVEKVTQFTDFYERVVLKVPEGADEEKALKLLEKAERACLITNSMTGETHLDAKVVIVE